MLKRNGITCLGLSIFIGALALVTTTACREWRKRHHELVDASRRGPEYPRDLKFERIKCNLPAVQWVDMPNGAVLCLLPCSAQPSEPRTGQGPDSAAAANQGPSSGTVPLVHITARVFAGSVCDRPESKGLANVTAEVIRLGGSRSLAGEALAEEIEFLGADLGVSVSEEWVNFSVSGHSRHCRRFLQILTGLVFDPALPAEKLELCKGLLAETFRRENDRPGDIAQREFMRQIFPEHPYGWRTVGEAETVKAIALDQVVAFHKRNYIPPRLLIGIAGDFDAEAVRNELRTLLPTAAAEEAELEFVPRLPASAQVPGAGVVAAAYRKLPQTSIVLGHVGVERKHPDYFRLTVLNALLGGATSRLRDRVRTKLGLTYAISGRFSFMSVSGYFSVSTSTKTESAGTAIAAILDELERVRIESVEAAELESAKDFLANSFVFRFDTPADSLAQFMAVESQGLPRNYLETYRDRIAGVTIEDLQAAAKEHLDPKKLCVVVVGEVDLIAEDLGRFGKVILIPLETGESTKPQ